MKRTITTVEKGPVKACIDADNHIIKITNGTVGIATWFLTEKDLPLLEQIISDLTEIKRDIEKDAPAKKSKDGQYICMGPASDLYQCEGNLCEFATKEDSAPRYCPQYATLDGQAIKIKVVPKGAVQ